MLLSPFLHRLIIKEFGGWEKYQELLRTMRAIADEHEAAQISNGDREETEKTDGKNKVTIAMVAVAWVLSREGVGAVIVGVYG